MITKTIDERGRLVLGPAFAGRTVIVDDSDPDRIVIIPAKVVPAREAWLHENEHALALVLRGLAEAKAGISSENPPDIDADAELADRLDD